MATGYYESVLAAGGVPLVVPPSTCVDVLVALLDRVDAILFSGGADLNPLWVGEEPIPQLGGVNPVRDEQELLLVRLAADRQIPMLGICRGMQVMAVAAGGRLHQHLPEVVGHFGHSPVADGYGRHDVTLCEGSWLRQTLGARVAVPTHHHQAVAAHPGLVATGLADDGVVEALEAPQARLRVGVQWHPEVGEDDRLFRAFVDALR